MAQENEEILRERVEELERQNERLSRQLVYLMGERRGELPETEGRLEDFQHRLMDFIMRVSARMADDKLFQVMAEEFLIELRADRVVLLVQSGSSQRSLVVTEQACESRMARVPLPYFVPLDPADPYKRFLDQVLDGEGVAHGCWPQGIEAHPDVVIRSARARGLQIDHEGAWVISLEWEQPDHAWSQEEALLFEDLARYASLVIGKMQHIAHIGELKDQMESLLNAMPSAVISLDFLGSVTAWSGRAQEFLGIDENEALGRSIAELLPDFAEVAQDIPLILQSSAARSYPYRLLQGGDGKTRWLQARVFHLLDADRGEIGLRIDDVTRDAELLQQLLHSQKMETVGNLAGGMAHDFNNILGGITGTLGLIRRRSGEGRYSEEDRQDFQTLESCANRARALAGRLLTLSRPSDLARHELDLRRCLEGVRSLAQGSFGARFPVKLELPDEPALVLGDNAQIESALLNLCLNARDAMPEGGALELSLQGYEPDSAFLQRHGPGLDRRWWRITVRDQGVGMDAQTRARAFRPFFTTKGEGGTGLGLAIVEQVIQLHEGLVELESKPGEGSRFSLFFPVPREEGRQRAPRLSLLGRALVVDPRGARLRGGSRRGWVGGGASLPRGGAVGSAGAGPGPAGHERPGPLPDHAADGGSAAGALLHRASRTVRRPTPVRPRLRNPGQALRGGGLRAGCGAAGVRRAWLMGTDGPCGTPPAELAWSGSMPMPISTNRAFPRLAGVARRWRAMPSRQVSLL